MLERLEGKSAFKRAREGLYQQVCAGPEDHLYDWVETEPGRGNVTLDSFWKDRGGGDEDLWWPMVLSTGGPPDNRRAAGCIATASFELGE